MIEVYQGELGNGKTLSAVSRIVAYLASGGTVYTNIHLYWDRPKTGKHVFDNVASKGQEKVARHSVKSLVAERYGVKLQDVQYRELVRDEILRFYKIAPPGTADCPVLVVIDETHLELNARDWSETPKAFLEFLNQSRKEFTDLVFLSPKLENIDKQVRRLMQYVWSFRDLKKHFRFEVLGIGYPFPHILQLKFQQDAKTLLERRFWSMDKGLFDLYDTYQVYSDFGRPEAVQRLKLEKIKKGRGRLETFALSCVLVLGWYGVLLVAWFASQKH